MRNSKEYLEWKAKIHLRDNYICQECGKFGKEAHHIKSWKAFPELRFQISNGKTLCKDCHNKTKIKIPTGIKTKIISASISEEFFNLAKSKGLSWSEAMKIGLAILLMEQGEESYKTELNINRIKNIYETLKNEKTTISG